jgi:pyocin large subunit-like protein
VRGIRLLFGLLLALAACDAGPSAVLPDGAGKAPAEQVQPAKAPAGQKTIEEASMPVVDAAPPVSGDALPVAAQAAKITATRYGDWPLWSQNRKYSADENAHYHFRKHGPEFSAKSYPDYMAMVHGFIHNPPAGTETLKRTNGDTLFYDPKGNVFAVMTRAGAPRTMFRPDNGAAYWRQQKIIESRRRTPRRENYSE